MSGFFGVTFNLCQTAFDRIIMPVIQSAAGSGITNKYAGCLLVLNPSIPYEPKYRNALPGGNFDELVLWQDHFWDENDSGSYPNVEKYIKIARAKAFTSYLTGLPSHQVQQVMPSLYVPGMTKWGGSAVAGAGPMRLITAFSGVQWNFDQMISEMMISAIQALCHEQLREVMASDEAMIIGPEAEADD